jgi:PST family polysaccharide transporter
MTNPTTSAASTSESLNPNSDSLDRSALAGVAWSGAAKWSTQVFAWAGTMLVARMLSQSDFGLLTSATVFLSVVMMLTEFGIGTAVITLRELQQESAAELHTFSVLLGSAGTLATIAMAYPLGLFFRAPQLPPVLMVIGFTFFLSSLQTVPAALLRRELRFRTIATVDFVRGLIVPVVTVTGALLGLRYWALVLGSVVAASITSGFMLYYRPVRFARPRLAGLAPVLTFSRHVLVSRLAWVVYQDGDFAVAGRRLSMTAVGEYGMAWSLASAPIEKVTNVLSEVTPAIFGAAAQSGRPALRRLFLNLSEVLCLGTFPAALGLSLVSVDLVEVMLGEKWTAAAGPLSLLALYAGVRSVTSLFGHAFNAVRETRFAMWTSIALAILLMTGFIVGSHWGTVGIAAAWLIIHPGFSAFSFTRIRSTLDVSAGDYLRALRLGLDGSAAMGVAVLTFQYFVAESWPAGLRLPVSIVLGAGVFIGTTLLAHGTRIREIIAWVRRIRSGGSANQLSESV